MSKDDLNIKQERFCVLYCKYGNATRAYMEAFSTKSEESSAVSASRLLRNDKILARIRDINSNIEQIALQELGLSKVSVLNDLLEIKNRCMKATPVTVWDREEKRYVETGEWQFNGKEANKSLELIGKELGMFNDKTKVDLNVSGSLEVKSKLQDFFKD